MTTLGSRMSSTSEVGGITANPSPMYFHVHGGGGMWCACTAVCFFFKVCIFFYDMYTSSFNYSGLD